MSQELLKHLGMFEIFKFYHGFRFNVILSDNINKQLALHALKLNRLSAEESTIENTIKNAINNAIEDTIEDTMEIYPDMENEYQESNTDILYRTILQNIIFFSQNAYLVWYEQKQPVIHNIKIH